MDTTQVANDACSAHGASQHADELAMALEHVVALKPQVIVEIGCDRGGTLYAWRQVCERVYGITSLDNSFAAGGSGWPLKAHGARVLGGDSHDATSLAWLTKQLDGASVDVLVIDGDHSADGVRQDVDDYGPLVRSGGLMLLHDIYITSDPRAEVYKVWPELIERYGDVREILGKADTPFGWGMVVMP